MKASYLLKSVVFLLLPSIVLSYKILFLCSPTYSHVQQMSNIADALIAHGHETWITALPAVQKQLGLKERRIHVTPLNRTTELLRIMNETLYDPESGMLYKYLTTGKRDFSIEPMKEFTHTVITDEGLTNTIQKENFDLMIIDNIPMSIMFLVLPYKYDVPFVLFGPYCDHFTWRIPFSPAFVPFKLFAYTDKMSFIERLSNTQTYIWIGLFDPFGVKNTIAAYVPEKPFIDMENLQRRALLFIIEVNPLLDFPYPAMPNVIKIGFMEPRIESKLPEVYANFLDRSANGVVVVSFGSLFPNDNFPILEKLATAFTSTKYDFIVRGAFMKNSSRVIISNWIPQKALLKHENVTLFVTHCGTNAVGEAISNSKPMLCFPLFGDQPSNGALITARGYGLQLDLFESKIEEIIDKMNEIIDNPSYKLTIERASRIKQDFEKREKPSEVAAFWIEQVVRFGGDHLRSSSSDMPLYQYLLLDVLAFLFVIVSILVLVLFSCLRICCRKFCAGKSKEKVS